MSLKHNFNRKFIAVQYPGIVQNVDKMIETLGGIENISTACCTPNRRLELRFRPNDLYCKPACADRHNAAAFLLRVRVKRIKKDINTPSTSKESDDTRIVSSVKALGFVDSVYKFTFPCEFQYLPIESKSNGELVNLYNKLLPEGLPDASWLEETDISYFFPPATFSRMDTVEGYMFRKDNAVDPHSHQNIIGRTRRRRSAWGCFANISDKQIPDKPRKNAINLSKVKLLDDTYVNTVRKLFEERPIWSRNALLCVTKFRLEHMKYILPTVAYYFVNGPWRVTWIRFGFDPRKDPSSRKYQTLDYRLRMKLNLRKLVTPKRCHSKYLLPYKSSHSSKPKTAIINKSTFNEPQKSCPRQAIYNEDIYIFKPGTIPPTRQMFYQYCDIHVDEIQEMLARLPVVGPDAVYHERHGWMPQGMDDRFREIINGLVKKALEERENRPSTSKTINTDNNEISDAEDDEDEDCNPDWEDI